MTAYPAGNGRENPYQAFPDEAGPTGGAGGSPDTALQAARPRADAALQAAGPHAGAPLDALAAPRRFRWLAVLVGYGSDYLLTEILTDLWTFYMRRHLAMGDVEPPSQTSMLLAVSFLGTMSSVVGGLVCGTVAKRDEVKHGLVQLVFGFLIFMTQVWKDGSDLPGWYYVVTVPAVALATLAGAQLAALRRARRESRAS